MQSAIQTHGLAVGYDKNIIVPEFEASIPRGDITSIYRS